MNQSFILKGIKKKQSGEIATVVTLVVLGIMAVGIFAGSKLVQQGTRQTPKAMVRQCPLIFPECGTDQQLCPDANGCNTRCCPLNNPTPTSTPAPFNKISPSNNTSVPYGQHTFSWTQPNNPIYNQYIIEFYDEHNRGKIYTAYNIGISNTSKTIDLPSVSSSFVQGGIYLWQVFANNGGSSQIIGNDNTPWAFQIAVAPTPTLTPIPPVPTATPFIVAKFRDPQLNPINKYVCNVGSSCGSTFSVFSCTTTADFTASLMSGYSCVGVGLNDISNLRGVTPVPASGYNTQSSPLGTGYGWATWSTGGRELTFIFATPTPTLTPTPTSRPCITEGQGGDTGGGSCCDGLRPISDMNPPVCISSLHGSFICARCGNGTCGLGENYCNCNTDCSVPTLTPTNTPIPSLSPSPTLTPVPANGTINGWVYINNCGNSNCNLCSRPGGQTVSVKNGATTITTCATDTNGYYSCSVPPGTYTVSVSTNTGETCSWGSKTDPNYCLGTGCSQTTTVVSGASVANYFTVFPPSPTPTLTPTPTSTPLTPSPTTNPCPRGDLGNLNCDANGLINAFDLSILLVKWAPYGPVPTPGSGQRSADVAPTGGDRKVGVLDLSRLLSNWKTQ